MNKVWTVWGDNGESYDDHTEWLESVHATEAGALAAKATLYAKLTPHDFYRKRTTYEVIEQEVLP